MPNKRYNNQIPGFKKGGSVKKMSSKKKKLAAMYPPKDKITRGDFIAAAKKKEKVRRENMASKYHKTKSGKMAKKGLWYNIHQKRKRGEKMRKPGSKGAPTAKAFKRSQSK